MDELKPAHKYTTLSEALENYLDPEQADPGSFRMGVGNLFHTASSFLGMEPEQIKERLAKRSHGWLVWFRL